MSAAPIDRVTLRPARAADAALIAWGLDAAADGLFGSMLGRHTARILTEVIAQPATAFSYEHVTIAEMADDPVGCCQGWPTGTPAGSAELARAAGPRILRMGAIALLGWPLFSAMTRHDPGEWYVQAIAVRAQARGSGVGRVLFADALARARSSGSEWLTLDVDVANVRAMSLYSRLGLTVVSTSPRAVLLGGAQAHRMRVDVSDGTRPARNPR